MFVYVAYLALGDIDVCLFRRDPHSFAWLVVLGPWRWRQPSNNGGMKYEELTALLLVLLVTPLGYHLRRKGLMDGCA